MKIVCLTVGKKHDANIVGYIDEFEKRLSGFCDFSWQFIPSSDKQHESDTILKFIKPEDKVLLLDERGEQWSNQKLASKFEQLQNQSTKRLVVVIGGAFGVEDIVSQRSDYVLALSNLVFPHQMVRLIVVEQLYRTYSILSDGKYHHL